ncbi:putative ribonuclease H protein [Acorus calamus]|uniref:Ribonuclease H protein n=1 Tax=Acorus calamus TaxID=4465 RepID=A0AAV9E766_ACOCL|nr:putative ribonuclease H protein [Acorus calamus]
MEGGLGIHCLKDVNLACQAKLAWRSMTSNSCWASFMNFRYLHNNTIWDAKPAHEGSCIWKSFKKLQFFLKDGTHWIIGNGENTRFWIDKWLGDQPLCHIFPHLTNTHQKINWIINAHGEWDTSLIDNPLLKSYLQDTRLLPCPDPSKPDSLGWEPNDLGPATVKTCWDEIRSHSPKVNWHKLVWHPLFLPRVNLFLWRAFHKKTPTDEWSTQRGFSLASRCHLCHTHIESELHIFFECEALTAVWDQLALWFKVNPSRMLPLEQSLSQWSASLHLPRQGKTLGKIMFLQCLDEFWKARNEAKFNETPPPHPSHILNTVRKSISDSISLHHSSWSSNTSTATLLTSLGLTIHPSPPKLPIEVKWLKPEPNWNKLNVDGAAMGNPRPSGAGGLFRDHHGIFLLGFSCSTKHNTNTFAEFFALYREDSHYGLHSTPPHKIHSGLRVTQLL